MKDRFSWRVLLVVWVFAAGSFFGRAATGPQTFSNGESIVFEEIVRGPGTPYPSSIPLSGFTTAVSKVTVTLHNISHSFPDDLDIVLVGPRGQSVMLMSDAGADLNVSDVTLTFDDSAATVPPNSAQLVSGSFRPVNHPLLNDTNPPPAPPPPYGATLAVFNGTDPNGTWSLYALDDTSEDGGVIADGWSLTLSTDEPIADLSLAMTTSPSIAAIGTNIIYTIVVTNHGPANASGVTVVDTLPSGVAFISAVPTVGACSNESGVVRCSLGSLAKGVGGRIQIVATPTHDGILTNSVVVSGQQRDHLPLNNTATSVVPVTPVTDLAVKVAPQATALQGELLSYAVAVTNEGAASATGVRVSFPLPDGITFVSAEAATGGCTNNAGIVQCALGGLNGHAGTAVTFLVRYLRSGVFTNVVAVTGDQFDHDLADNTGTTLVTVQAAADISITAQASAEPAGLGQPLTYLLVVSNGGPARAGVTLSNALPAGVAFISAGGGSCTNLNGLVSCEMGLLEPGMIRALALTVRPMALGTMTNTTTAISSVTDPVTGNNTISVITTVVPSADLVLSVMQFPDPVWRPEPFSYTVTVSNAGPSTADGVALRDVVPPNAQLVSFQITQGSCVNAKGTIICDVGTLESGHSATLRISMVANQVGPLTNRANTTATQPDGNPRNNSVSFVSAVVAPVVRLGNQTIFSIPESGPAELFPSTIFVSGLTSGVQQVRVFLNSLQHERLDDLDILLVAPNGQGVMLMSDAGGDSAAEDMDLRFDSGGAEQLPDASPFEGGRFRPTDYSDEGAPDQFPEPAPTGPYTTDLSVFNGIDPNGAWSLYIFDDQPTASGILFDGWTLEIAATAPIADVVITSVDLPNVIAIGSNAFSITISNQGPFVAKDVRVTNAFPAELGVLSVTASQGGCELVDGAIVCAVGDLAPGSSVIMVVFIAPPSEAVVTNVITVFGQFSDFDPSNNVVSFITSVDRPPSILSGPQNLTLTNLGVAQFTVTASGTQPLMFQWLLNDVEISAATNSTLVIENPGPESEGAYRTRVYNRVGSVISDAAVLVLTGPPRISAIPDQSTDEDVTAVIPFLVRDAETLSEELTVSIVSSNLALLPNNAITVEGSGDERIMRLTPSQNQSGAAVIVVRVEDSEGHFSLRSFTLTVRPVNDPPSIPSIPPQFINEDTVRSLLLILGDIDSDPQSLVLTGSSSNSAVVADSDITVTGSGIGQRVTIQPGTNVFGTTLITLVLTDGEGGSTTYRFPLTVLPVNDPPTIDAIDSITVDEDSGPHAISLTGISSGISNEVQRLRVSATSNRPDIIPNPTVDYVNPDATGSLNLAPLPDAHGSATITVTVNDSQTTNNAATRTFVVTVQPVDDPPHIVDIPDQTVAEDTPIFLPILVHDVDTVAGLTITAESSDSNLVSNFTYSSVAAHEQIQMLGIAPNSNQVGTVTITVTARDATGLIATDTFLLTVTPVNNPPTLDSLPNIEVDENAPPQTVNLVGIGPGATNENQQIVAITATSGNPVLVPHPAVTYNSPDSTGTLLFEVSPGQSGIAIISVTANDGQASNGITKRTFTVTVHPQNQAPAITAIGDIATSEDTPVTIPVFLSDPDSSISILSVVGTSSNPNVVANSNIVVEGSGAQRFVTILPNADRQGSSTITLTVSDGSASGSAPFLLTVAPVNDPPTLDAIPNVTVTESRGLFQVNFSGVSSGATNESQPLNVSVVSENTGLLTIQSVTYSSPDVGGTIRLRTANFGTGLANVRVTADDGAASNNIITRTFIVFVMPASNTAPTISDITNHTTIEDTPLPLISFTVSDAQTPAANLVLNVSSSNPNLVPPGNLILGGAGNARTLAVSPAPNAVGSATITVSVRDGDSSEVTDSFLFTVTPANDLPSMSDVPDITIPEDSPTTEMPLSLADADTLPHALTVTANPLSIADVLVVGAGTNRVLLVTPKPNQTGSETLRILATDGVGTVTQDVQLTITAVNDSATVGLPSEYSGQEDTAIEVPLSLIDSDTPPEQISLTAASSDQLVVPDANITFGGSGTNRTLLIKPATNQFGQILISVSAIDDLNSIATASLSLTILPVNDPPTLNALSNVIIAANGPPVFVNLGGAGVGPANESQPMAIAAVSSNTLVLRHPEVDTTLLQSSNLARLILRPVPGTRGISTVRVTVSDGQAHTNRTFAVSVDGPPTIQPIPDLFAEVDKSVAPVRLTVADPESGAGPLALAVQASNSALFANLALGGSGGNRTLTITPAPQQLGSSMIQIVVTDTRGNSASNSFLFAVGPSSSPPVIQRQPQSQTVAEGKTVVLDVAASGHPLTFQWQRDRIVLPGETNATLTLPSAQRDQSGEYRVMVSNLNGTVASATATVRILAAPEILSITVEGEMVRISIATVPGEIYSVESQSETNTNWTAIVTFSATDTTATVEEPRAERRLYRVRVE